MSVKVATPRYGHGPIEMRKLAPGSRLEKAGDFVFVKDEQGRLSIVIGIPMSKDLTRWAACEWTIGYPNHCGAQWQWDRNKGKPTLTPSLHWVRAWHGWVRKGFLVEA